MVIAPAMDESGQHVAAAPAWAPLNLVGWGTLIWGGFLRMTILLATGLRAFTMLIAWLANGV